MYKSLAVLLGLIALANMAKAHIAFYDPSMWGFNVTAQSYSYDNRPMVPLMHLNFNQWWFHGHLDHPPNPGDLFELPAGKAAVSQLACNKGATKWWASSEGTTDIRQNDYPCPNSPLSAFHTTGINDLKGCALAITYNSDVNTVQPEDFAVFSVNQTCVWMTSTEFQVPAAMPSCPPGGCICAWFWIHSIDSGSEQMYMNGFRCDVTGATSTKPVAKSQVARRCGADPSANKVATPSNCTYGAKQPLYWYQNERNNMFEGQYSPPYYNDLYNFKDGAQNDIFQPGSGPSSSSSSSGPYSSSLNHGSSSTFSSVPYSSGKIYGSSSVSSSVPYSSSKIYGSSSISSSGSYSLSKIYGSSSTFSSWPYSSSANYGSSSTSSAEPYSSTTDSPDDDCGEYSTSLDPSQSSYSSINTLIPSILPSYKDPHHHHGHSTVSSPHRRPSSSSRVHSHEERKLQNAITKHYKRRINNKNRNNH